jgi:hypothetical protein
MKVGEFQKAIGANANSYRNFMAQNGPYKGSGSMVYVNAFAFFKKRELMGKKLPKKKVKKEDEAQKHDVSGIHLDGESDGEVPVFETCDEVRRKIRAYLTEPSVTQAGFLRAIAQTHPEGKKFQSKSLNDFLGKKGPDAGNTSGVFYAAYVFFEKMRLKDGKPKSKHREEMEKIYNRRVPYVNGGKPGFDIKTPSNRGYWCRPGEHPQMDQYGRVRFR